MDIKIPCETYARLASIPEQLDSDDHRKYFNSIFIERHNSQIIAVVTNVRTAAIELIGASNGPDESFAIAINPMLKQQCITESAFSGEIHIISNPMLNYVSAKTGLGYSAPGNLAMPLPENNAFIDWRSWFPDELPSASSGNMYFVGEDILAITNASPSGALIFPENIDVSKPVVVRDEDNADWFGLFMPNKKDAIMTYLDIPLWCR